MELCRCNWENGAGGARRRRVEPGRKGNGARRHATLIPLKAEAEFCDRRTGSDFPGTQTRWRFLCFTRRFCQSGCNIAAVLHNPWNPNHHEHQLVSSNSRQEDTCSDYVSVRNWNPNSQHWMSRHGRWRVDHHATEGVQVIISLVNKVENCGYKCIK